MLVKPELLVKYAENRCTDAEKATVEQWMSTVENGDQPGITMTDEHAIKNEMWSAVSSSISRKQNRHRLVSSVIRFSAYPAAACLIVAFLFLQGYTSTFSRLVSVNNITGHSVKKIKIDNLEFVIEPGSSCSIEVPLMGNIGSVKFCGAVSVMNTSGTSRPINIRTGLLTCLSAYSDKVVLRRGQTYLAMTDDKYNMITATTEELKDGIPGQFSSRLHKRFSL